MLSDNATCLDTWPFLLSQSNVKRRGKERTRLRSLLGTNDIVRLESTSDCDNCVQCLYHRLFWLSNCFHPVAVLLIMYDSSGIYECHIYSFRNLFIDFKPTVTRHSGNRCSVFLSANYTRMLKKFEVLSIEASWRISASLIIQNAPQMARGKPTRFDSVTSFQALLPLALYLIICASCVRWTCDVQVRYYLSLWAQNASPISWCITKKYLREETIHGESEAQLHWSQYVLDRVQPA